MGRNEYGRIPLDEAVAVVSMFEGGQVDFDKFVLLETIYQAKRPKKAEGKGE